MIRTRCTIVLYNSLKQTWWFTEGCELQYCTSQSPYKWKIYSCLCFVCLYMHIWHTYILIDPVLHTHFSPRKNEYILVSPPGRSVHTHFPPPERSLYIHLSLWFLGEKSEYILKIPPHTQFPPFALIDYTRAIAPIRGRPYGDFCRAFDAEEGRSQLFFSICNTFWNISQWLQFVSRHHIALKLNNLALNNNNSHKL